MLRHLAAAPLHPSRVVVVGAAGFVGGAIAARLESDGIPVLRVSRREIDLLAADAGKRLGAMLRAGDVLVAAAAMAPCKTPEMLRDNMSLALALVTAAAGAAPSQIVNISSDAVYSDSDTPLTESAVTAPDNLHGAMHVAREVMFRNAVTAPLATLRPSLLYGPGDPHNGYGPNRFRRLARAGEPIVLFGQGEERRDHVFIADLAELAARVIDRRSTGVLNVATGVTASFADIATAVVGLSGKTVPVKTTPRAGPMPHNGYRPFDAAGTRAAFPDFAYTALEAGLARSERDERAP